VDTGANVYRIDFEPGSGNADPATWQIRTLAALGDASGTRKFFYTPDLVQTSGFTAVMMGSGNREQPLLTTSNDRFYTVIDYKTSKGAPSGSAITEASLIPAGSSLPAGATGCYMSLDMAGEKVVTGAVSTGGYTYFSTNKPNTSANSCVANLGTATTYRLPLFCGSANSIELVGGGLPPTPVVGAVDVVLSPTTPGGPPVHKQVPFIIGGFNQELSPLAVSRVPVKVDPTRKRTFWMTSGNR
jgi:type IV pilus assembly protein PilY1